MCEGLRSTTGLLHWKTFDPQIADSDFTVALCVCGRSSVTEGGLTERALVVVLAQMFCSAEIKGTVLLLLFSAF